MYPINITCNDIDNSPPTISKNQRRSSVSTRLSRPIIRRVDERRSDLPIPKFAIPEVTENLFPKLKQRHLYEKIPHFADLGAGDNLYYTRGLLGRKVEVNRSHGLKYTVEDEYNQRTVPKMSSYDPLHDRNLTHYLTRPTIKQHLVNQGLLRYGTHVICNLERFNEFRRCLGVAQNERLAEVLRREHEQDLKRERNLRDVRALAHWKPNTQKSLEKAVSRRKAHDASVRNRLLDMLKQHELRREQAEHAKAEMRAEMIGFSIGRETMRRIAYDKVKLPNIDDRRNLIMHILQKEQAAELRLATDRIALRKFKKLKDLHRIQTKINAQIHDKGLLGKVQNTFEMRRRKRAEIYEENMREKWRQLPIVVELKRLEAQRIMALVRKYFYRWLNRVRQRRKRRKETKTEHLSHWNVTDTMEKVNDTLCENRVQIIDIETLIAATKRITQVEDADDDMDDEAEHVKEEQESAVFLESLNKVDPQATLTEQGFQPNTDKKKKNQKAIIPK